MPTRRPTSGAAWLTLHLCDAHAKDAGLTEPSAPTHPLPPTFARAEHMYSSWRQLVLLEALAIVREGLRRCRKHERGLELALEGARGPERRGPPGLGALSFSSSSRVPSAEVRPGGVFLLSSPAARGASLLAVVDGRESMQFEVLNHSLDALPPAALERGAAWRARSVACVLLQQRCADACRSGRMWCGHNR